MSLPSLEDVQRALICVASTDELDPHMLPALAKVLLPYTDPDQRVQSLLEVREAILRGRKEPDVDAAREWWAMGDELAMIAAVHDREQAPS